MIKVRMVDGNLQPIDTFEVAEFKTPKPNDLITFEKSTNWWKITMVHLTTDEQDQTVLMIKVIPEENVNVVTVSLTKKCISSYGKLADKLTEVFGKKKYT